jgi:hypothetical protein
LNPTLAWFGGNDLGFGKKWHDNEVGQVAAYRVKQVMPPK